MRFNASLLFMMAVAAVSAFAMPPNFGDSFRNSATTLFLPVTSTVRQVAWLLNKRLVPPRGTAVAENGGGNGYAQLRDENENLKYRVSFLKTENERLQRQLNDISQLDIKDPVRIIPVIGGDPGSQQVLSLQLASGEGVIPNMPVMYPYGLVGKLEIVGLGTARVRLITDNTSRITGEFVRYQKDTIDFTHLPQSPKTVEGTGNGKMVIKAFKAEELTPPKQPDLKLQVGDWVVVKDKDLPPQAQGRKLGEIESIVEGRNPMFVQIVIRPQTDLMKLREVMVMVRK